MTSLKYKLWNEVSTSMDPETYDGDIEFAVRHSLVDVAVYLWSSTGASSIQFSKCPVSSKQFQKQVKVLNSLSDSFECKSCNHIGRYDKGYFKTIDWCYNCGDKTIKHPN